MTEGELTLRDAEASDIDRIVAIYNHEVEHEVTTFDTRPWQADRDGPALVDRGPRYPLIVARRDGQVVGWGSLSRWSPKRGYDRSAEISVYVDREARGGGVGTALIGALIERGRAAGLGAIITRIAGGNPASVGLHEAAGFTTIGVQRRCGEKFGRVLDVTLMELLLD